MNTYTFLLREEQIFNYSHNTILSYVKNGKLFRKEWILSTSRSVPLPYGSVNKK